MKSVYISKTEYTNRLKHKPLLNDAFRALRSAGFLAKQSFSCCKGCASTKLNALAEKLSEEGKPVRGVVYYHQQDAEYFDGIRGALMIRFGHPSNEGENIRAVARETLKALKAAGIQASWNRRIDRCIEVDLGVRLNPVCECAHAYMRPRGGTNVAQ